MELVVVIALITLLFSVAVPRFKRVFEAGSMDQVISYVSAAVQERKEAAFRAQKPQYLYLNLEDGEIGTSAQPIQSDSLPEGRKNAYRIPQTVRIRDVEWPGLAAKNHGLVQFCFFPAGYTQYAVIHLSDDNGRNVSLVLEPFLGRMGVLEGHKTFENNHDEPM